MAEKSEKATPKKLRDARKKGQVAKSQDFPSAITFVVSISTTLGLAGYLFNLLAANMISTFRTITSDSDMRSLAANLIGRSLEIIIQASIPMLVLTLFAGILTHFLTVGPVFSPEAMKPDIKRLNPIDNLKNMFKFKTIFELLKSLFKITGASILIYTVVWNSLPEIIATAGLSLWGIMGVFADFLFRVVIRVGIFFLIIAIIDLIYQKRRFANEMKMEKFEVKQEFKDTEGDPHIKGKRKQTAQEIAYQEGPNSVRRAKAVITNPTHVAVALSYREEVDPSPRILTMGKGVYAKQIIDKAEEFHIPIMRNIPLAHSLFDKGKINDYIPEETYQAVAEVLKWIERMESEEVIMEIFE